MGKKICFFCHRAGVGGAERVITTLAGEFCNRGYNVTLITTESTESDYEMNPSIKRIVVNSRKNNVVLRTIERIRKLRKTVKSNGFECIISFSAIPNIQILIALLGSKTPVIISERTDPCRYPESRIGKLLRKILYPRATRIVFQTADARNYFEESIQSKSTIIPNPISSVLPTPYNGQREKRIVGVGALVDQKNWPMFLEASKLFLCKHDDYFIEIYGEGNRRTVIEKIINEDPLLQAHVQLKGFVNDPMEKIKKARMYVSSSDYEGISNSMLEALAMGIPTICTDCPVGGARQCINGKNGILVPTKDSQRLFEVMDWLANDAEKCESISKEAIKIREKYNLSKIADLWETEVLRICNYSKPE